MKNGTVSTRCVSVRPITTESMANAKFQLPVEPTPIGTVSDVNVRPDSYPSMTDVSI